MIYESLKKYKFFMLVVVLNIVLFFVKPDLASASLQTSSSFFLLVLKILPPVLILMGLLDAWIPSKTIEAHLGEESGLKGSILSIFLGTAASGPLFVSFPIALSMRKKGVRWANVVIFIGSWATIKIPMLVMESSFLSLHFALWRFILTVPFIVGIGYLMEKVMKKA